MSSSSPRYTAVAILLHWMIAVAILANLGLGWWMHGAIERSETRSTAVAAFQIHKSIGLTVLLLSAARLGWRLGHPPPALPAGMSRLERLGARATHGLFYGLMIVIPLSGWVYVSTQWRGDTPLQVPTLWFGLFEVPHLFGLDQASHALREQRAGWSFDTHWILAWSMAGLLVLHVAAALKHQFVNRDDVLARMVPALEQNPDRSRQRTFALRIGCTAIAATVVAIIALLWQPVPIPDGERPTAAPPATPDSTSGSSPTAGATTDAWVLDREASAIEFSGSQGGSAFEGRFERWTVDIRIDPENIEEARIEAQIETASATDGNALHDRTLAESEWFDPDTYPYARYRSTEIEPLAEGGYRIAGVLTIKNNDIPVPSLRLTLNGDTATIRGQTVVNRAAADLGMSSDPEGEWVSRQIEVNVNAMLSRP